MTEDRGEIKIRYTLKQGKGDALSSETVHSFHVSRWKVILFIAPILVATTFFAAFFFSIFFALFLFTGAALGILYWLIRGTINKAEIRKNWEGQNGGDLEPKIEKIDKRLLLNDTYDTSDIKDVEDDS